MNAESNHKTGKRRELSVVEKQNSERLKAIYEQRKSELNISQVKVATDLGISQSAVRQYINGVIPLNISALLMFAVYFKCNVKDIAPYCPYDLTTHPEESALLIAYRDMVARGDKQAQMALLQVAQLSPEFSATLKAFS